ncbi:unnamed protein product [Rotaria sp. Silwood2]|nr:unnamed protein product [Rotaria sp. Silwood2]CAF2845216.1 unnamed protein product [Rotaria sp. Silwood2]CAF4183555.1 unnamed protein product [Rotaria sp. Silwood2]CAF4397721.1 unnamed protein product [Rotaria sp. Silwood2]
MTKLEIATALIILKLRHKLTTKAISDICLFLRLFRVPNAPKSYAAVKRVLERKATKNITSDIFQICQNCNKIYQNVCDNTQCHSDVSQAQAPAFLKFQIKDQIQSILASENNFTLHSSSSSCYNNCITDIQHANWYQSIALNENTSNFITLSLNVDGISMSDSSDNSLWIFTVS